MTFAVEVRIERIADRDLVPLGAQQWRKYIDALLWLVTFPSSPDE
jgi:hypothetical protein